MWRPWAWAHAQRLHEAFGQEIVHELPQPRPPLQHRVRLREGDEAGEVLPFRCVCGQGVAAQEGDVLAVHLATGALAQHDVAGALDTDRRAPHGIGSAREVIGERRPLVVTHDH